MRKSELKERTVLLKQLDTELSNVGKLGRYTHPQKAHFDELNLRIATLKDENKTLSESRDEQKKVVQQIDKELEAYQAKYGR